MRRMLVASAVALAIFAGMAPTASAAPITGFISFGGNYTPVDAGGSAINQDAATGVDITNDIAGITCALSSSCEGTYSVLNGNLLAADYFDFQFDPLGGSTTPLWQFSFGGVDYTFNLETVNIDQQDDVFLTLTGTGTLTATGFDDTLGNWSFSGDTTNGGGTFAFSSTNSVSVPEPASLALFSLGLFGAAVAARRRKQQMQ